MRIDISGSSTIGRFEVFLDGQPLRRCVMADEERGEAVCFSTAGGRILLDEERNPIRVRLAGRVEVRPRARGEGEGGTPWVLPGGGGVRVRRNAVLDYLRENSGVYGVNR